MTQTLRTEVTLGETESAWTGGGGARESVRGLQGHCHRRLRGCGEGRQSNPGEGKGRQGLRYGCVDVSTEQVGGRKGRDHCHMARHMKEITICHRLNRVPQPQIHMLKS